MSSVCLHGDKAMLLAESNSLFFLWPCWCLTILSTVHVMWQIAQFFCLFNIYMQKLNQKFCKSWRRAMVLNFILMTLQRTCWTTDLLPIISMNGWMIEIEFRVSLYHQQKCLMNKYSVVTIVELFVNGFYSNSRFKAPQTMYRGTWSNLFPRASLLFFYIDDALPVHQKSGRSRGNEVETWNTI